MADTGPNSVPRTANESGSSLAATAETGATNSTTSLDQQSKILGLALRGDWSILEQVLRSTDKNNPDLHVFDEVSLFIATSDSRLVYS